MRALIVVESYFGNTRTVARAFRVAHTRGPLLEGEERRAEAWADQLASRLYR